MTLITNDYEAFEFVKNHLLTQKEKSVSETDECLYRGYSSTKIEELKSEARDIALEENILFEDEDDQVFYELLADETPDAMCAVGCLILEIFYDPEMEGKTLEADEFIWDAVVASNPVWKMNSDSYHMLKMLQNIHDGDQPQNWEIRLSQISSNFNEYGDYKERKIQVEE